MYTLIFLSTQYLPKCIRNISFSSPRSSQLEQPSPLQVTFRASPVRGSVARCWKNVAEFYGLMGKTIVDVNSIDNYLAKL